MRKLSVSLIAAAALAVSAMAAAAEPLASWDTVITGGGRFRILAGFGNMAVLDRETDLVWERSPDTGTRDWLSAKRFCVERVVGIGNRIGWRLPTVQELASVVDPTQDKVFGVPALPAGHPFTQVQADFYWTATTFGENPALAWGVSFEDGILIGPGVRFSGKEVPFFTWCVRTGHPGSDVQ